jgi:asparagine synthase (glutamine-hydrolysing)
VASEGALVDGHDQMRHHRRFKNLYLTRGQRLQYQVEDHFALCAGEHTGFARHPGGCVHRRAVLAASDLWIVADRITGQGGHDVRLHWLRGDFPHAQSPEGRVTLDTPAGPFEVAVFDEQGHPATGDVVRGALSPPRGWSSRYYHEKVPVPSLAVSGHFPLPYVLVTVLAGGGPASVNRDGACWHVHRGTTEISFRLDEGLFQDLNVNP